AVIARMAIMTNVLCAVIQSAYQRDSFPDMDRYPG
ncbi:MAG: hypothetical protein ACI8VE_002508, partial [Natrialbaceae archaeon]